MNTIKMTHTTTSDAGLLEAIPRLPALNPTGKPIKGIFPPFEQSGKAAKFLEQLTRSGQTKRVRPSRQVIRQAMRRFAKGQISGATMTRMAEAMQDV